MFHAGCLTCVGAVGAEAERLRYPRAGIDWGGVASDLGSIAFGVGSSVVQGAIMRFLWGDAVGGGLQAGHRVASSGGEAYWGLGSPCSR